jgi:hypothetical protein
VKEHDGHGRSEEARAREELGRAERFPPVGQREEDGLGEDAKT